MSELFEASRNGIFEEVDYFIEAGADVNELNKALCLASENGHLAVVNRLIEAGADVHAWDDWALCKASENGHLAVVNRLIEAGANISYALLVASMIGHLAVVNRLLEAGADVHYAKDGALRGASMNGHLAVANRLLEAGADVHPLDDGPLRLASENGHLAVVNRLIEAGADVHALEGRALCLASENGHLAVVNRLIEAGADVHALEDRALVRASENGHLAVVNRLIEAGADVHAQNDEALRVARLNGHIDIVNRLQPNISQIVPTVLPIEEQKRNIISTTLNAIKNDNNNVDEINLTEIGQDIIMQDDITISKFINEPDNKNNSFIWKMYDSKTKSRIFMINKDQIKEILQSNSPVVYPCLQANGIPGKTTNVVTELPLYSFATIFNVRILIHKYTLDEILQKSENIYVQSTKKLLTYPSIASHKLLFENGSMISGLHCNPGSEPEQLWNIKEYKYKPSTRLVEFSRRGGYYDKYQKYVNKLDIIKK